MVAITKIKVLTDVLATWERVQPRRPEMTFTKVVTEYCTDYLAFTDPLSRSTSTLANLTEDLNAQARRDMLRAARD